MATADTPAGHEGHHEHVHYTSTGLENRKIAIWALIGSECMLFASLISTYLIYKGRSKVGPFPHEWSCKTSNVVGKTAELVAGCAPADVLKPILDIPVTSQSTFVLLMSSLAMVLALAAVENKGHPLPAGAGWWDRCLASSKFWLMATAVMGVALYWHFVDVVWIAIFTLIYLIQ